MKKIKKSLISIVLQSNSLLMGENTKYILIFGLSISFVFYSVFIYRQPIARVLTEDSEIVMAGKMIWQQKNCGACHQIYGLGGFLGPDLTNVYSTKGKGPVYIQAFIKGGTAVMPSFNLQEQEVKALLEYLRHIDASGKSDPKLFNINYDGTIERQ